MRYIAALALVIGCAGTPTPVVPGELLPVADAPPAAVEAPPAARPAMATLTLPADLATVDVVDLGGAPRARLPVAPLRGQDVRLTIDLDPEVGGAPAFAPDLDVALRVAPISGSAGETIVVATITALEVDDDSAAQVALDGQPDWRALDAAAASLRGATLTGAVWLDGHWSEVQVGLPEVNDGAAPLVQLVARAFPPALVVPEVDVGPGATWTVTRPTLAPGGVAITAVTTFVLDRDGASIEATTAIRGDDQRTPGGVEVRAIAGRGAATFVREADGWGLRSEGELDLTMLAAANGPMVPLRDRLRWRSVPRAAE